MRRSALPILGLFLALYVAYPYVTLWRLDQAIRKPDIRTLDTLIDWGGLRRRLKADVKLALIDKAQTDIGKGGFAGIFGGALTALLVPTLVDSAVDEMVTPEKLVHNEKVDGLRRQGKSLARFVTYAFFTSPTAFRADLKDPDDKDSPTITTLLELTHGRWRIVALKLPPPETWLKGSGSGNTGPIPPPSP
jgi:hypothetical protein